MPVQTEPNYAALVAIFIIVAIVLLVGALALPGDRRAFMAAVLFLALILFRRDISLVVERGRLWLSSRHDDNPPVV